MMECMAPELKGNMGELGMGGDMDDVRAVMVECASIIIPESHSL